MTNEEVEQLIRDADPYRPEITSQLAGADQTLLEEIMSVPTLEPTTQPSPPDRAQSRRRRGRRIAGALVAAAVLVGLVMVPSALHKSSPTATQIVYSAAAVRAAENNPRLLIDEGGWKVDYVEGFSRSDGTIRFTNGDRAMEMRWKPAAQYRSYYADRLGVSQPEAVRVEDQPGDVFRYNAHDFAVMLRPRDGAFVELRTNGPGLNRDNLDDLLAHVVRVDVDTWLAALPPTVVTPMRVDKATAEVLADVPIPPGFDGAALDTLGTNDRYQFGAKVTSRVGCAWIAEWRRADKAGDTTSRKQAARALESSHNWKVLNQMSAEGDWPEVFWQIADQVAAGHVPVEYKQGLGCD
jgi:hypothetical protein